ncbi:MAG: DUF192 domain-containing protein [Chloroflexota bacterium]
MISNQTRGTVLAGTVHWATSPLTRFYGLVGRAQLPQGEALVLVGEKGVHTHFMRFPIDVVFYDRDGVVVEVAHTLRPWRFSAFKTKAVGVIELPAGTVQATGTLAGDSLSIPPTG